MDVRTRAFWGVTISVSILAGAGLSMIIGKAFVARNQPLASPQTIHAVQENQNGLAEVGPGKIETREIPEEVSVVVPDENVSEQDPVTEAPNDRDALRELQVLAITDFNGALAIALRSPAGDERDAALTSVCLGLAQRDPAHAVRVAQNYHLDGEHGGVVADLVQNWASSDLTSALNWAKSQPTGETRDGAVCRIAYVLSRTDPAKAANLILDQLPANAQEEPVIMVLHRWAQRDLAAASAWVARFPESELRARAMREVNGVMETDREVERQNAR